MASEQLEEYLESILDIEEKDGIAKTSAIAKCMRVAPASVTEALQTLADKGFVHYEPYRGAYLTEQGREMARKVKRRHRLLEVFLSDVLHINGENVHEEACKMEHTLSDETECALCKMLNAPARCPHGSLIEACDRDVESCSSCLLEVTRQLHSYFGIFFAIQGLEGGPHLLVQMGAFHRVKTVVQVLLKQNVPEAVKRHALFVNLPDTLCADQTMLTIEITT